MIKILFFTFLTLVFLNGCDEDDKNTVDEYIEVGVYAGEGSWDVSVTAVLSALRFFEFQIDTFQSASVFNGDLHKYRVIVFPGGDARVYSSTFGAIGMSNIREYIEFGGSFLGLGGGAAIADSGDGLWRGIGVFAGDAKWPVDRIAPYPEYTLTGIDLVGWDHDVGRGSPNRYTSLYRWGPEFINTVPFASEVIYSYTLTGTPAVVAFDYGAGRVVLSGCQLEIEESGDRDDTDFASQFDDPESEWDIIERAVIFCLSEL